MAGLSSSADNGTVVQPDPDGPQYRKNGHLWNKLQPTFAQSDPNFSPYRTSEDQDVIDTLLSDRITTNVSGITALGLRATAVEGLMPSGGVTVDQAIAAERTALLGGAGEAFDTLGEIKALSDAADGDFTVAIDALSATASANATAIAGKLDQAAQAADSLLFDGSPKTEFWRDGSHPARISQFGEVVADWNTVVKSGVYQSLAPASNSPVAQDLIGEVYAPSALWSIQRVCDYGNTRTWYERFRINSVWQAWKAISGPNGGRLPSKGDCVAWVNFNGFSPVTVRDSYNVSSVVRSGIGNWVVNLANDMSNDGYCVSITSNAVASGTITAAALGTYNSATPHPTRINEIEVKSLSSGSGGAAADIHHIHVAVFGSLA